jgi:hypothetical protein
LTAHAALLANAAQAQRAVSSFLRMWFILFVKIQLKEFMRLTH